jgi:hypothetical protein
MRLSLNKFIFGESAKRNDKPERTKARFSNASFSGNIENQIAESEEAKAESLP